MPNRKGKDKDGNEKYFDIAFPVNADLRKEINDAIIAKYNEAVSDSGQASQPAQAQQAAPAPADEGDPFSGLADGKMKERDRICGLFFISYFRCNK